jgi:hypothetical protein
MDPKAKCMGRAVEPVVEKGCLPARCGRGDATTPVSHHDLAAAQALDQRQRRHTVLLHCPRHLPTQAGGCRVKEADGTVLVGSGAAAAVVSQSCMSSACWQRELDQRRPPLAARRTLQTHTLAAWLVQIGKGMRPCRQLASWLPPCCSLTGCHTATPLAEATAAAAGVSFQAAPGARCQPRMLCCCPQSSTCGGLPGATLHSVPQAVAAEAVLLAASNCMLLIAPSSCSQRSIRHLAPSHDQPSSSRSSSVPPAVPAATRCPAACRQLTDWPCSSASSSELCTS